MIWLEDYKPHTVSEVICIRCGKRWICVRPSETLLKDLECPDCGESGFVVETGQELNAFPCADCGHWHGECRLRIHDVDNCEYYKRRSDEWK